MDTPLNSRLLFMIVSVGIRMPIQIAIPIPMPINAKWSNIDGIDIFTLLLAIATNIKKHALVFYEKIMCTYRFQKNYFFIAYFMFIFGNKRLLYRYFMVTREMSPRF